MTHDYEAQLVAAVNAMLADADMDLRVTHANTEAYTIPVPAGMGSLFAELAVHVERRTKGVHHPSVTVHWRYTHPAGGSNGYCIGWTAYNEGAERMGWHANVWKRPDDTVRVGTINPATLASEPLPQSAP